VRGKEAEQNPACPVPGLELSPSAPQRLQKPGPHALGFTLLEMLTPGLLGRCWFGCRSLASSPLPGSRDTGSEPHWMEDEEVQHGQSRFTLSSLA
jgi:hypothetical protein